MTNALLNIATSDSGCEMIIAEFVFQVRFLHYLCVLSIESVLCLQNN